MIKYSFFLRLALAFALAGLTACGGGGGTSSTTSSSETFQLRAAFVNYFNDSHSYPFTVSGSISDISVAGSGTTTEGSQTASSFEGKAAQAKTSTMTATLTGGGKSLPLAGSNTTYIDSNYTLLGFAGSAEYEVATAVALPLTARVNETGIWYNSIRYSNASKTRQVGTAIGSYVLEPDSASTALLKIIVKEKDTSDSVTSTSTLTFRITTAGGLTRLRETLTEGSAMLTLSY